MEYVFPSGNSMDTKCILLLCVHNTSNTLLTQRTHLLSGRHATHTTMHAYPNVLQCIALYSELRRSERECIARIAHVSYGMSRRDTYLKCIAVYCGSIRLHDTIHLGYMYRGKTVTPPRENGSPPGSRYLVHLVTLWGPSPVRSLCQ